MDSPHIGDIQRIHELRQELNAIEVPEESTSGLSNEMDSQRTDSEIEDRPFDHPHYSPVPQTHDDFNENSMISSLTKSIQFEESGIDCDPSMRSHSFTPQQVSNMMDWSRAHITPTEGLFPQVSAPSMSIEEDLDLNSEPHEVPQKSSQKHMSSFDWPRKSQFPVIELPTHDKLSQEGITFSPTQQETNWYFKPASARSKHSSFCSDLVAQGSALLANAGNFHFQSEKNLLQVRESAAVLGEISKLNGEVATIKVALRKEQGMHERSKNELQGQTEQILKLEAEGYEKEQKLIECEEYIQLLQGKLRSSQGMEQSQGKTTRSEVKQLKGSLAERDRTIEKLKKALAQISENEQNGEEIHLQLAKVKILNSGLSKQVEECNVVIRDLENSKKDLESQIDYSQENSEFSIRKYKEKIQEISRENQEKTTILANVNTRIEKIEAELGQTIEQKNHHVNELKNAKSLIDSLQEQLNGSQPRNHSVNYDEQLKRMRNEYDFNLQKAHLEIDNHKKYSNQLEGRIKAFEDQMAQFLAGQSPSDCLMTSEQREYSALIEVELTNTQEQFISKEKQWEAQQRELLEQIENLKEKDQNSSDNEESQEKIRVLETRATQSNRTIRKLENSLQEQQDLTEQYGREMNCLRIAREKAEHLAEHYKNKAQTEENEIITNLQNELLNIKKCSAEQSTQAKTELLEKQKQLSIIKTRISELETINEGQFEAKQSLGAQMSAEINENLKSEYSEKIKKVREELTATYNESTQQLERQLNEMNNEREELLEKLDETQTDRENTEKKLRTKISELNAQIEDATIQTETDLNSRERENEQAFRHQIAVLKSKHESERQSLQENFANTENSLIHELREYQTQIKILQDKLTSSKKSYEDLETLNEKLQTDINEQETDFNQQMEDLKTLYNDEISKKDTEFSQKLKKNEQELTAKHEQYTRELQEEFNTELQSERDSFNQLLNLKEQVVKADSQRSFEELMEDREQQLNKKLTLQETKLKSRFEAELHSKTAELQELQEKMKSIKEEATEYYKGKISILKQEHLKNKREWDREKRKLKEQVDNAMDNAKTELELAELEKINAERKDWDRKLKQKVKLIQHKHEKELQDKESLIKSEIEREKTDLIKTNTAELMKIFKQEKTQLKQYYEDLKETSLEELQQQLELKIRRDSQDSHMKIISQLESDHYKEKEILREQMQRRIDDIHEHYKFNMQNSIETPYYDLPCSSLMKKDNISETLQQFENRNKMLIEDIRSASVADTSACKLSQVYHDQSIRSKEQQNIYFALEDELQALSSHYFEGATLRRSKTPYPQFLDLLSNYIEKFRQGHDSPRATTDDLVLYLNQEFISLKQVLTDLADNAPCSEHSYAEYRKVINSFGSKPGLRAKLTESEEELRQLSTEYKNYMLKTKDWVEQTNAERNKWQIEKKALKGTIEQLKQEESGDLSPEMLSPSETCTLILGIFNRSNHENLTLLLLERNPEFLSTLQDFLKSTSKIFTRTSATPEFYGTPPHLRTKLSFPLALQQLPRTVSAFSNRSHLSQPRISPTDPGLPPQFSYNRYGTVEKIKTANHGKFF